MKPVVKGILIGCGTLIVLGVIAAVAVGIYVKRKGPELIAAGEAAQAEGQAYGGSVSESRCVDDMLDKYRRTPGFTSAIRSSVWLKGCLETSAVEEDFCTGVPPKNEFIASAKWQVARCTQAGLREDAACRNILDNIQDYCAGDVRKGKLAAVQ